MLSVKDGGDGHGDDHVVFFSCALFPFVSSKSPRGATVSAKPPRFFFFFFFCSCVLLTLFVYLQTSQRNVGLPDFSFSFRCEQAERTVNQIQERGICHLRGRNPQTMRHGGGPLITLSQRSDRRGHSTCLRRRTPVIASQGSPNLRKWSRQGAQD